MDGPRRRGANGLVSLSILVCSAAPAIAQSGLQWLPGDGVAGTNSTVFASVLWDPDGAGPQWPVVVLGGGFSTAGNTAANCIATYNPLTGQMGTLGAGFDAFVDALLVTSNGTLIAGGFFSNSGGTPVSRVAQWNGTAWAPLGAGCSGMVTALAELPNGDIVAGGLFTNAGGAPASRIARWNGAGWSPLGSGMTGIGTSVIVRALEVLPSGDLVAGGNFTQAGGVAAANIARWDGTAWWPLGSGTNSVLNESVWCLSATTTGALIAGGVFSTAGGASANCIASWDGAAWSPLGSGMSQPGRVLGVAQLPNGALIATGLFSTAGGVAADNIAQWNGSTWAPVGGGLTARGWSLCVLQNGDLMASGQLHSAGSIPVANVARWNGTTWNRVHGGFDNGVSCSVVRSNGDLVVGGSFTAAGHVGANRVARWDGANWSPLGSGIGDEVRALAETPNGDLYAGSTSGLARWDGASWQPTGWPGGLVIALAVMQNGDLAGAGINGVFLWNGASWTSLGSYGAQALCVLPNGDLVAGGSTPTPGHVVRWDGTTWSEIPGLLLLVNSLSMVNSLVVTPGGDLLAGCRVHASPQAIGTVARWNGSWSVVGPALPWPVHAAIELPNGDVLAGMSPPLTGGNGIARWDGSAWSPAAGGTNHAVLSLRSLPDGDVLAGGLFTTAGTHISAYFARMRSTAPASAAPYGTGCNGSAGLVTLAATQLPWLASTFRATTSGLPAVSLALGVLGFGPTSVPLPSILAQGVPGCTLLAVPDMLTAMVPLNGTTETTIAVPNAPSLIGVTLRCQTIPIEFGAGGVVAITASNGLTLTIGVL